MRMKRKFFHIKDDTITNFEINEDNIVINCNGYIGINKPVVIMSLEDYTRFIEISVELLKKQFKRKDKNNENNG